MKFSLLAFLFISLIFTACSKKKDEQSPAAVTTATASTEITKKIPLASSEAPQNNPVIKQGYSTKYTCSGFLNTNANFTQSFEVSSTDVKDVVLKTDNNITLIAGINKGKMLIFAEDNNKTVLGMSNSDITSSDTFLDFTSAQGRTTVECTNETVPTINANTSFQCTGALYPYEGVLPKLTSSPSDYANTLFTNGKYKDFIKRINNYISIELINIASGSMIGYAQTSINSELLEFASEQSDGLVSVQCLKL